MRKIIILGCAVLLAACSDTPTQPMADDVDAQFGVNGADVDMNKWDYDNCYYWGDNFNCYAYGGMWHRVQTPSGNYNYFYKEDGMNSWGHWHYWPYAWWHAGEGEWDYDQKFHIKKGQQHVYSWSETSEWTEQYYGVTYQCSYVSDYHFANGKVTKNVYDYTCTYS